jgi:hypothetical protein
VGRPSCPGRQLGPCLTACCVRKRRPQNSASLRLQRPRRAQPFCTFKRVIRSCFTPRAARQRGGCHGGATGHRAAANTRTLRRRRPSATHLRVEWPPEASGAAMRPCGRAGKREHCCGPCGGPPVCSVRPPVSQPAPLHSHASFINTMLRARRWARCASLGRTLSVGCHDSAARAKCWHTVPSCCRACAASNTPIPGIRHRMGSTNLAVPVPYRTAAREYPNRASSRSQRYSIHSRAVGGGS